jgi:hypothetical protein
VTQQGNPVVVVQRRRPPHELLLLIGHVFLGAYYLIGAPAPASIAASQPSWSVHVWAAGMLISGVAGLIGLARGRSVMRALRLEAAAMDIGAGVLVFYAVSLFAFAGADAMGAGATLVLWAAANLWRARQISRELREVAP